MNDDSLSGVNFATDLMIAKDSLRRTVAESLDQLGAIGELEDLISDVLAQPHLSLVLGDIEGMAHIRRLCGTDELLIGRYAALVNRLKGL